MSKKYLVNTGLYTRLLKLIKEPIIFDGVSIVGCIGIGKTYLVEKAFPETDGIADKITNTNRFKSWHKVYEIVDKNPYLEDFYKNIEKYSPLMECRLLSERYIALRDAYNNGKLIVTDYGNPLYFANMLFLEGYIDKRDFDTFIIWASITDVYIPRLCIKLEGVEEAQERLKLRGRGCESNIELKYQKDLDREIDLYLEYIKKLGSSVYKVDWTKPNLDTIQDILLKEGFNGSLCYSRFIS